MYYAVRAFTIGGGLFNCTPQEGALFFPLVKGEQFFKPPRICKLLINHSAS